MQFPNDLLFDLSNDLMIETLLEHFAHIMSSRMNPLFKIRMSIGELLCDICG